ncbi:hypothetical protein PybrP1_005853 [[Pythium] brassicae (nom. inval.)]|nr:hypothetical protein PybrP1_005853 [[Pythium] brassicae (nom. inval.)]
MRLLRRACTNPRTRRRSVAGALSAPSSSLAAARSPYRIGRTAAHRHRGSADAVASVVKQFHALALDQRHRAVNRVLQRASRAEADIEQLFKQADKDRDGLLNPQEFRAVFASRFSLKTIRASADHASLERPTTQQLKLVMVASAIPFVGFGFVDNIIMLAAGDMIEDHFHATYHISMLCAAALGNTVADVVGLSLGGIIETFARRIGIPDPQLSKAQANMSVTHWCNFFASAGGITIGCLLGMFPLLFMNHSDSESDSDADAASSRKELDSGDQHPPLEAGPSGTGSAMGLGPSVVLFAGDGGSGHVSLDISLA